jgi:hypothetical protein
LKQNYFKNSRAPLIPNVVYLLPGLSLQQWHEYHVCFHLFSSNSQIWHPWFPLVEVMTSLKKQLLKHSRRTISLKKQTLNWCLWMLCYNNDMLIKQLEELAKRTYLLASRTRTEDCGTCIVCLNQRGTLH